MNKQKKSNLKIKPTQNTSSWKTKDDLTSKPISSEMLEDLTFWKQEIQDLQSRKFKNMNEAVAAIVEGVLKRIEISGKSYEEMKEVLKLVLETDESIQEELRQSLDITSKN